MLGRMPVNTQVRFKIGSDKGVSRNWLVADSLERGSEWMFFIDDDHTFASTILLQLLSHDKPVVASLCLQRENPFWPTCYESRDEKNGMFTSLDLTDKTGLQPIVAAGAAGMLIRSEVFYEIEPPWFLHTDEQSEDLYFCRKAAEAGFPLFVDLNATLGHINPMTVVPRLYEGEWIADLVVSQSMNVGLRIGE
jgi:GT2 family glycosyltransferase